MSDASRGDGFEAAFDRGRSRWPSVRVARDLFRDRLARAAVLAGGHEGIHAEDLFLVTALEQGDEGAWRVFQDTYRPFVLQALTRIVRDRGERAEIADEVLSGLYLPREGAAGIPLNTFSGRGALKGWVQVTAVRRVYRRARERARDAVVHRLTDHPSEATTRAPERAVSDRELVAALRDALGAVLADLPEGDRTILRLRYARGFQLKELGRWYGQDKSTVSKRLKSLAEKIRGEIRRRLLQAGGITIEDFEGVWAALGREDAGGFARWFGGGK